MSHNPIHYLQYNPESGQISSSLKALNVVDITSTGEAIFKDTETETLHITTVPNDNTETRLLVLDDVADQVMYREVGSLPGTDVSYEFNGFQANTIPTVLNVGVYSKMAYPDTPWMQIHTTGDFTLTNDAGTLKLDYIGSSTRLFMTVADLNGFKTGGGNDLIEFQLRKNGVQAGFTYRQKFEDINKWQIINFSGLVSLDPGDDLTFWLNNATASDDVTIATATIAFTLV